MSVEQKALPVSSSTPPKFAPEQENLFQEVLRLLNEKQVPYMVSGAFALQQHTGIWRDTKDLDLFVAPEQMQRALGYLQEAGFDCEICDPVWLAKARRGDYFVDLITGMSNAVIMVDQSWFERSIPAEVLGVQTRVLAAEELLASKLFVLFRERYDGADMAHIIFASEGRLDWNRVLELVGEHWELLLSVVVMFHYIYPTSGEFVPKEIWEELIGRLQRELIHPSSKHDFRGSLLDEKMFAIDVKEWGMQNLLEEYRARRGMNSGTGEAIRHLENKHNNAA
ncbi:MAG: nucleotidyltransferase family protein [Acidobacteriales bacterium]|nr:nucleotidyltransferase family protein [Terriglobales bacterium]